MIIADIARSLEIVYTRTANFQTQDFLILMMLIVCIKKGITTETYRDIK